MRFLLHPYSHGALQHTSFCQTTQLVATACHQEELRISCAQPNAATPTSVYGGALWQSQPWRSRPAAPLRRVQPLVPSAHTNNWMAQCTLLSTRTTLATLGSLTCHSPHGMRMAWCGAGHMFAYSSRRRSNTGTTGCSWTSSIVAIRLS